MRYVLLLGVLFFAPAPALAGGAFACMDACSRDPRNGMSCDDLNMGCNPITRLCVVCSNDSHCAPGGTCVGSQCLGLVCIYDAGPDAGDTGTPDAEDGGLDTGVMDAEPLDADPMDAAAEDAIAFPDARSPTDPIGGPRGMMEPKDPFDDGKCGCTTTAREGSAAWMFGVLLSMVAFRKLTCKR